MSGVGCSNERHHGGLHVVVFEAIHFSPGRVILGDCGTALKELPELWAALAARPEMSARNALRRCALRGEVNFTLVCTSVMEVRRMLLMCVLRPLHVQIKVSAKRIPSHENEKIEKEKTPYKKRNESVCLGAWWWNQHLVGWSTCTDSS